MQKVPTTMSSAFVRAIFPMGRQGWGSGQEAHPRNARRVSPDAGEWACALQPRGRRARGAR